MSIEWTKQGDKRVARLPIAGDVVRGVIFSRRGNRYPFGVVLESNRALNLTYGNGRTIAHATAQVEAMMAAVADSLTEQTA